MAALSLVLPFVVAMSAIPLGGVIREFIADGGTLAGWRPAFLV